MVGILGFAILAGTVGGVLTPSLLLDLVSFWPGLVLAAIGAGAIRPIRRKVIGLRAVLPLMLVSWLLLGLALHFSAWPPLPSSQSDLTGPVTSPEMAELSLTVPGVVRVVGGEGALYSVRADRRGGPISAPQALESIDDRHAVVLLAQREESAWFRFAGWSIELALGPVWSLDLVADELGLDLTSLAIERLSASGEGEISLPATPSIMTIKLSGDFLVLIAPGQPASVSGIAEVPATWEATETGSASPVPGDGYIFEIVEGSAVVIEER